MQSKAKMIQTFLQELVSIVGDPSSVHISIETKPTNTLLGLSFPAISYGVDAEVDSVVFISSRAESQSQ